MYKQRAPYKIQQNYKILPQRNEYEGKQEQGFWYNHVDSSQCRLDWLNKKKSLQKT